ncbi:MAG: hypothetical protein ACXWP4_07200, partial [Polyangiales bacterium]
IFAVTPARFSVLRYAAVVYAVVLIVTKLTANPLGGNVSRLNQYAAGPLLACLLWERRRALFVLVAIPLLFWQWFPAFDTIAFAGSDPSTHSAYYQPLLGYFAANPPGFGRVEIPVTYRHWETAIVAPELALARGWERQLDYAYDKQFYDRTLNASSYRAWLAANGVRYVALPDTQLDDSSLIEAKIVERGQPYLKPVWHSAHWKVWEFTGYHGLVDGPARLESLKSDGFRLLVTGPGTVTVHIHDSPHWAVDGQGCTSTSADGFTNLHNLPIGEVSVGQALRGTRCDLGTTTSGTGTIVIHTKDSLGARVAGVTANPVGDAKPYYDSGSDSVEITASATGSKGTIVFLGLTPGSSTVTLTWMGKVQPSITIPTSADAISWTAVTIE